MMGRRLIAPIPLLPIVFFASAAIAFSQGNAPAIASEPVHIVVGKSVVINVDTRIKRILLSDPAVIDAVAIDPKQIVVEAKSPGISSLMLWDESGASRMLDVTVDLDLSSLRTAIEQAYPNREIGVEADRDRVILTGSVPNQTTADTLVKIAGAYSKQVIDSLTQPTLHQRQILLEVKIAEVDRTRLEQLGINFFSTGAGNTIGTLSTQQFGPITGAGGGAFQPGGKNGSGSTSTSANTFGLSDLLNVFLFRPDLNFGMTIKALEARSVLQILAEPNLLALDGAKASFLAGGEFPFPVVQGGQSIGSVTIQFQPFGVRLDFVGHITAEDTVRMHVTPEVSSLDFTNALTISGFTVPAISTRRAETEIELRNGQSFGMAGLLDRRETALLSKVPGIGDVPVLGKLFQSHSIQKTNTELIVLVTPRIVDPVATGAQEAATPASAVPPLDLKKYDEKLPGRGELQKQPQAPPAK
ncbi:MAG TPA: type II and III secretion system protein family protein [Candidatus Acidoferrales bacterium]|nr:type II and III secretion system protein family protein [Candidatus Acidoferrales bacterium]